MKTRLNRQDKGLAISPDLKLLLDDVVEDFILNEDCYMNLASEINHLYDDLRNAWVILPSHRTVVEYTEALYKNSDLYKGAYQQALLLSPLL